MGRLQMGACVIGLLGLAIAIAGSVLDAQWLIVSGFAIFALVSMGLIVASSKRSNLRTNQIKASLLRLEARTSFSSKEASRVDESAPDVSVVQVGPEFEYAARMESMQAQLETFALRSRSRGIRDSFARRATHGLLRFADLMRLLSVMEMGKAADEALVASQRWRPEPLLALARIAVNQQSAEGDLENAIRIFGFVERTFGIKWLGRTDRFLYLEALGALRAHEAVAAGIERFRIDSNYPVHGALLSLNSTELDSTQNERLWTKTLNNLYEARGLVAVTLADGPALPIDRLAAESKAGIDGPRVSILMPTYNGSDLIGTAIDSLLSQTWRNLEIIIVDDCSDESHYGRLQALSAATPRVTLIRQPRNLGAYCARNLGLRAATGEFITVHDDDDWSHPQKVELQVRHLLDNPEVPANMSLHARCTAELEFLRINNNPQFAQPNFSSLMVRRATIGEIGGWDSVNRGADAEFRDRIVAATGQSIPVVGDVPLSFTRTRLGSLTSGELARGYVDSARLLYLAAYQAWHSQAAAAGSPARQDGVDRPFPVPRNMEPGLRGQHLGRYDVIFATDFRFPGGTSSLTLSEIRTASAAGLRVGVVQLDSPLNGFAVPLVSALFETLALPGVDALSLSDNAEAALLVVRHPSVATFLDCAVSRLDVGRCILIVNNPPVLHDGSGMVFDLRTCVTNLDRLFSVRTEVVAESGLTRNLCRGLITRKRLSDVTWPGMVSVKTASAEAPNGRTPVLGRHSRDHELKWPSRAEDFKAAYTSPDGKFTTVLLGGGDALVRKFGADARKGLTVHPYGALDVDDFLASIHFWAYFHDDRLTESFGMAAAEAMAAGKVVFLPHYMEATFGDGAVYCTPEEIPDQVAKFSADSSLYLEQSGRARQLVAGNFSANALLERIAFFSTEPIGTDKKLVVRT